jgi:hypothetical protein
MQMAGRKTLKTREKNRTQRRRESDHEKKTRKKHENGTGKKQDLFTAAPSNQ